MIGRSVAKSYERQLDVSPELDLSAGQKGWAIDNYRSHQGFLIG
jgi:hypothetical protein